MARIINILGNGNTLFSACHLTVSLREYSLHFLFDIQIGIVELILIRPAHIKVFVRQAKLCTDCTTDILNATDNSANHFAAKAHCFRVDRIGVFFEGIVPTFNTFAHSGERIRRNLLAE